MKLSLGYDKKNVVWYIIVFVFALVLYVTSDVSLWLLVPFVAGYVLVKSIRLELSTVPKGLWTIALFAFGAYFSVRTVQYLLLEPELFLKLSTQKWMLNVCCALILYLFIQMFTNHVALTCVVAHSSLLLLGFINYYVYLFRQNEFIFSDLKSVGTGLSVAGKYHFSLHERGAYVLLGSILFFAFVRIATVTYERKWMMRIVCLTVAVLAGGIIAYHTTEVSTETWEQKGSYRNGYLLNFLLSVRDSYVAKPEGYSLAKIAELEEEYSGAGEGYSSLVNVEKPTIIVIMNESFADLSVLGELRTNIPLTPFLDSLSENTLKGYALSSVFGAKTPNSEWEYMTGSSMAFLPEGSVVYQQYMNDSPSSIVSTLKGEGYTCVAMHPYYETGWSRNQIYPLLGFDEMYFINDFDSTRLIREYISDEEMYDKVIERFERKGANEKLFLMGITMQNHGGYTTGYDNFKEEVYKTGTSYTDANQYLSLIHESDLALQKLITYFESVEEPVEIVFFGDHQPSLNNDFYPILNGKGLSGLTENELEALFTVPFFIWTNYESPSEEIEITSLNYLSTLTLERAGIALPAYHQFLADMMEVVPAINARGYYSVSKGKYLHVEDAKEEEADWILNYEMLQYNGMFEKKDRSSILFPYKED